MSIPRSQDDKPWRLLIVEDHPAVRCGLRDLLRWLEGIVVCGEAEDPLGALQAVRDLKPDLVLLDIRLPGGNGIDLIKPMLEERPEMKIVMLSASEDRSGVRRAVLAGARGYMTKDQAATDLFEGLRVVIDGGVHLPPGFSEDRILSALAGTTTELLTALRSLSAREYQVFQERGRCRSAQEIATNLGLSIKTVETHRSQIMKRLQIYDVAGLVLFAVREQIISLDD